MATSGVHAITLDWPPSLWRLYTIARGRRRLVLTKAGREYKERAGWQAKSQGVREMLEGAVCVEANLYPPVDSDADNALKAPLDAMTGVAWNDDGQVVELHVYKHPPCAVARLELTIATRDMAGLVLCRVKNLGAVEGGLAVDVLAELKGE